MRLAYEYITQVNFSPSIGRHTILLRCLPAEEAFQQIVEEQVVIAPDFWQRESRDGKGNRVLTGGTLERHDKLEYASRGVVEQTTYCIPDSHPHPIYRQASEQLLTEDAEFNAFLSHCVEQTSLLPPDALLKKALDIMHFVHHYLHYEAGVTRMNSTLQEVLQLRKGVCQDFAHLMIALCRKCGMNSRYVCGLIEGEGQTHAWVEVHDGMCWYAFDPTNDTAVANGYIKLAHGTNAHDCPVSRGTYLGMTMEKTDVVVRVRRLE